MEKTEIERKSSVSFNDFVKITKWVVGIIYSISPIHTTVYILFSIIGQIRPIVNSYIIAKILDYIVQLASTGEIDNFNKIYGAVGLVILINLVFSAFGNFESYISRWIDIVSYSELKRLEYIKLNNLGIQTLQDPEINNQIYRAQVNSLVRYYEQTIYVISSLSAAVVSLGVVLQTQPMLAPLVFLITIPRYLEDKKYRKILWKLSLENTEDTRKANRSANDLRAPNNLQEIFINNAFGYLDNKFTSFYNWYNKLSIKVRQEGGIRMFITQAISEATVSLGFIKIFYDFFYQKISVGDVYFQINTVQNLQRNIYTGFGSINNLFEFCVRIKEIYELFNRKPSFEDGKEEMPVLEAGPEIQIKNLTFTYPNTQRAVLRNFNLNIKPGEKVAIIGKNGAGKTTLVRLLAKMHLPDKGKILINGKDITGFKADSLHRNMGVLFQDYNNYNQLTVRENILIGNPLIKPDEDKIIEAAKNAEAHQFIQDLPKKYDQLLSETFKGGIKLSTGQWQKLAIARFFYRNAPLVIFDEPTAAIDAESEYNIFNKIYDFFKNKTVIIISHRFSTVRNADRILVLSDGKIVEEGSHQQLMHLNGEYARAFTLQAKGYNMDKIESIA